MFGILGGPSPWGARPRSRSIGVVAWFEGPGPVPYRLFSLNDLAFLQHGFLPNAALTVFLLSAVWHFGETDSSCDGRRSGRAVLSRPVGGDCAPRIQRSRCSCCLTLLGQMRPERYRWYFRRLSVCRSLGCACAVLAIVLGWGSRFIRNVKSDRVGRTCDCRGPLVGPAIFCLLAHARPSVCWHGHLKCLFFR